MIDQNRFALNRIAAPSLGLEEFLSLAHEAGFAKVELRNDLPGGRIVDGLPPARAASLARRASVGVISINALQRFNLAAAREQVTTDLDGLLELASAIGCPALVLCPLNDPGDRRDGESRMAETIEALRSFGPRFVDQGLLGYVEPLGFAESSLSSVVSALEAARRSGFSCYRIVYDTFHHHLGPDGEQAIGSAYDVSSTGLVHLSGVEADIPTAGFRDVHRVLPAPADRTRCRDQVARLLRLGYTGDLSFEPFSPALGRLGRRELAAALVRSRQYIAAGA